MIRWLFQASFAALGLLCAVFALALAVAWPVSYRIEFLVNRKITERHENFISLQMGRVTIGSQSFGPAAKPDRRWSLETAPAYQNNWSYWRWGTGASGGSFIGIYLEWYETNNRGRLRSRMLTVPCSYLVVLLSLPPAAWLVPRIRRRRALRRSRAGVCPACGYDLTGNISGVCPECGKIADLTPTRDRPSTSIAKRL